MNKLLFSVPRKDLKLEFLRGSGAGGQKNNKTSSDCRITHVPSGAVGYAGDERQQAQNRKLALERLVASPKFQAWVKMQTAMILEGYANVERKLDDAMKDENLKVELGVDCTRKEDICDK